MNDPHVVSLSYSIKHDDSVDYEKAKALSHETADFVVRVEAEQATVEMKVHRATADEARQLIEPVLSAWELSAALYRGIGEFEFRYQSASIIDRDPPAGHVVNAEVAMIGVSGMTAVGRLGRGSYPFPPADLAFDETVDLMFDCYQRFRRGHRTLSDAAYFCLTVAERDAGGRSAAAQRYAIDEAILRRLGDLTANKGGKEARKAGGAATDYTGAERNWLEAAMKMLIRRASQLAHDPKANWPTITMADLPGL